MRLQRVRAGGSRIEMQADKWTVEGAVKSRRQRYTGVKGEECVSILRESADVRRSKVVPQVLVFRACP